MDHLISPLIDSFIFTLGQEIDNATKSEISQIEFDKLDTFINEAETKLPIQKKSKNLLYFEELVLKLD